MRTLTLLLILANVMFFIWSQLIDVQVSPLDRARSSAAPAPRIVLAREAEQDDPGGPDEPPPAPPLRDIAPPAVDPLPSATIPQQARGAAPGCASVGPFSDLPQAAQAQAALRGAGYEPRQRIEQGELWVGHWVSVPDLESRGAADAVMRTLYDNGVTDVYLMPNADPYVVSLGVFSDYQRAQRRAEEVRALGFEPRISDRKREGSVYWIDVDLQDASRPLDLTLLQTGAGRITRLELRDCPAPEQG